IDDLRFEVQRFIHDKLELGQPVTTDDLVARINTRFSSATQHLQHLGAAILAPLAITNADIEVADEYQFDLTIDTKPTVHVNGDVNASPTASVVGDTVTVGIGPGPNYTVDQLVDAINKGLLALNATSGAIRATARAGRIAFQVLSTEIAEFAVEG